MRLIITFLTMFYSLYFACVLSNVDITLVEGNPLLLWVARY